METDSTIWRLFGMYVLIIVLMLACSGVFAQITVVHYNAEWNKDNGVEWINDLDDVQTLAIVDIAKQPKLAKENKIAVIPTIIIFKDDEEVARFQADLSFKMIATKEEVQEEIDNILMSDF